MSASSRGAALLRSQQRSICLQCRTQARLAPVFNNVAPRRFYSAEATTTPAAASTTTTPPPPPPVNPPVTTSTGTSTSSQIYRIKSGVILTRPPLLTRDLTPFEESFYFYQKRLNERLTAPFRKDFYFKKDTAADLDWRIKLKERHGVPAKDIGRYNPRGRMAWNDELLVASQTSSRAQMVEKLLADAEMRVSEDGEEIPAEDRVPVEKPMPRRTEADEKNDVKRLDRALDRTLYFVVKKKAEKEGEEAKWVFPTGVVPTEEGLHETAARILAESAGVNMNTWIVGRVPVAHHVVRPVFGQKDGALLKKGEKIFFLKGRIMAGQADLKDNLHDLVDFKWLTQEELRSTLAEEYFQSVKGMFAER
ncbi:39S mitochondrial ribosomal protein L46-domain-containing protein [Pseudoneurospora amorphoporcata]|uniref:Large ribosomal subunit protein mL46 n=1 Tax=Pseudoneurospora amorphoporcata TaxID=241081 RepID=A0AAN6SH10_9PEZI|nr:39S mitochondrial ribosomal protein L46-domain-containing protein [Pseudoneurospora amorphoporcata]